MRLADRQDEVGVHSSQDTNESVNILVQYSDHSNHLIVVVDNYIKGKQVSDSEAGVVVVDYIDNATGIMDEMGMGGGHFTSVTLNPVVTVTDKEMIEKANELHVKAYELCFIANSVNFPVHHIPICKIIEV